MLYRYLHTHGYETLRDHEFLVSPPGKFNDALDCAARIVGLPSHEALEERYGERNGWMATAEKNGFTADEILMALNCPEKVPTPERYAEVVRENFRTRRSIDKVLRVLCLCDADGCPKTDRRMWNRYAKHDGVRIGLDFVADDSSNKFLCRKVNYMDSCATIDLSTADGLQSSFDFMAVATTKENQWAPEREYRLLALHRLCKHVGTLDFLPFNREIIRRVDIGYKMKANAVKGLVKMIRKHYPSVDIYRMSCKRNGTGLEYRVIR